MTNIEDLSIFGDYKQLENRVTNALLHILNVGGEELIRFLVNEKLNKIFPSSKIEISAQEKEISSIPDGSLKCSFKFEIFIESKIIENLDDPQLKNHLKLIEGKEENILLYITKHEEKPKLLSEDVSWSNWNQILEWINEYIEKEGTKEGELLNYLFDNFEKLLRNSNITTEKWNASSNERVVIFAGGVWGEEVARNLEKYIELMKHSDIIEKITNAQVAFSTKIIGVVSLDELQQNVSSFFEQAKATSNPLTQFL